MTEPIRLAKRVAEMLPCSRREAELYIESGFVTVDGNVVDQPQFRVSTETVALRPNAKLDPPEPATILFHQSISESGAAAHFSVDNHDRDDQSGIEIHKRHFVKLSPTLPLQENASGLVVLTQDWRVARKLVDNAATVEQEYVVEVVGDVSPACLKSLNHRVSIDGKTLPPQKVSLQSEQRLRIALKGAAPGQIETLCEAASLNITSLKRIRIGRVAMAKLPPGQWRYLPVAEKF